MAGCAEHPFVWVGSLPPGAFKEDGLIHPRDAIVVAVRNQPSMTGELVVRDDGGVLVPTVGNVSMAGRTTADVKVELEARLATMIVSPSVTVSISRVAPIRVNVIGEVKTPATYELNRDRSVAAALAAAGWLTEFADTSRIFVVRRDSNLRVRFRAMDVTAANPTVGGFSLRDGDVVVAE